MMNVCLASLTHLTTGNAAILVAGKHDAPSFLPRQVLHGQAGYREVLITVWTCDREIGTSRVDHQGLPALVTFKGDVHASDYTLSRHLMADSQSSGLERVRIWLAPSARLRCAESRHGSKEKNESLGGHAGDAVVVFQPRPAVVVDTSRYNWLIPDPCLDDYADPDPGVQVYG
jgi:hypothetical protein